MHLHFMAGSSPKDGPSAGMSVCIAILSLMKGMPIPSNIGVTGELSLNGEACRVGGIQAKLIASKAINIDTVILPI